jgi:xanthine dehydrogenase YagS FAD-binding subunit
MLPTTDYIRANSLEEALDHLAEERAAVFAGGTDLLGCLRDGAMETQKIVSISALDELRGIESTPDGGLSIGPLERVTDIADNSHIKDRFAVLAQAAAEVASPQLRNQGTLGGNLCQRPRCWYFRGDFPCIKKRGVRCSARRGQNRYHAIFGGGPCFIVHPSDTAPALLALGASVRIQSLDDDRIVPLADFFVLPEVDATRENILERGEVITRVFVPPPAASARSSYRKVRERQAWDFALTSAAIALQMNGATIEKADIVLGGVAPIPWRAAGAERALIGRTIDAAAAREAGVAATEGADPLAQNGFKVPLVRGVVEESLLALALVG